MRTRLVILAAVGVLGLVVTACGSSSNNTGAAGDDSRTINIEMRDTVFAPDHVTVPAGQEVRLVFYNAGKVDHDAFIGDEMAQSDHEQEMNAKDSDMHHGNADSGAITVEPGKTGALTHTFEAGDEMLIGCHQPGHYAAGMKLAVTLG